MGARRHKLFVYTFEYTEIHLTKRFVLEIRWLFKLYVFIGPGCVTGVLFSRIAKRFYIYLKHNVDTLCGRSMISCICLVVGIYADEFMARWWTISAYAHC